ncbi:hypothetical protein D8B22_19265 [Verminephrobacter aporrectodeae subsp. tuberculatae]|uniref:toxin-antitoxin system TumE family protein n=1 Tax=Verminephrobacter aporrectodeae TaxID=1110389 RepID=UPI0011101348|nr:DUF6516 family protein [Verminephrobacter aporrectodeae]MCW8167038.1 hypothetical protein [Verminephrobacter aporrectodeae subsp. tuberculatae]MCW8171189.1 hypothetical protein [Verminephrobacter aporrectodeae subsp. tuberculatae]MCW8208090.1 hypothetical protein [Verminephrobacter aporrectodeae subsp. tuberculatae]
MAGKKFTQMERYAPKDVQIKKKLGGGVLKELVVREMPSGKVLEYTLAYINHSIYSGDHGRVLGYDNSHGFSHKHYFGERTPEVFTSYEALYNRFQDEWMAVALEHVNKGK